MERPEPLRFGEAASNAFVVIIDTREHVSEPSLRVAAVEPGAQGATTAGQPRAEPANSQDLRRSVTPIARGA